ncbi:MAG: hypothetical protein HKN63_05005, partial [Rhodobacteraceae bacterium]|nr:hypothetical protein [Paracoccaceae bacterium]
RAPAAAAPDPMRVARTEGAKVFDKMKLLGLMKGGEDVIVVLEHDGDMLALTQGQDVLPGYTVGLITSTEVRIENNALGLTGVLTLGERNVTRVLGVDG